MRARLQQFLAFFRDVLNTLNTLVFSFFFLKFFFYTFAYYWVYGILICGLFVFFFKRKKENVSKCTLPSWCYKLFHSIFSQSKSLIGGAQLVVQTLPRNSKVAISIARRSGEFVALSRVRLWLSSLLTWTILEVTTERRHDHYIKIELFGRVNNNKRAAFSSRSSGLNWCGGKRGQWVVVVSFWEDAAPSSSIFVWILESTHIIHLRMDLLVLTLVKANVRCSYLWVWFVLWGWWCQCACFCLLALLWLLLWLLLSTWCMSNSSAFSRARPPRQYFARRLPPSTAEEKAGSLMVRFSCCCWILFGWLVDGFWLVDGSLWSQKRLISYYFTLSQQKVGDCRGHIWCMMLGIFDIRVSRPSESENFHRSFCARYHTGCAIIIYHNRSDSDVGKSRSSHECSQWSPLIHYPPHHTTKIGLCKRERNKKEREREGGGGERERGRDTHKDKSCVVTGTPQCIWIIYDHYAFHTLF